MTPPPPNRDSPDDRVTPPVITRRRTPTKRRRADSALEKGANKVLRAVVACLVGSAILCVVYPSRTPSMTDARTAAERFVRASLKAPATATFSRPNMPIEEHADGRLTVYTIVDAQNSFGALLRKRFRCTLELDGDGEWRLIDIDEWNLINIRESR